MSENQTERYAKAIDTLEKLKCTVKAMHLGQNPGDVLFALDCGIAEIGRAIPTLPIGGRWDPNRCPACDEDLGGECRDGYYQNPQLDHCPSCRQMLLY